MRPLSVEIYCKELVEGGRRVTDRLALFGGSVTIATGGAAPVFGPALEDAISQSWQFPEARAALTACPHVVTLVEASTAGRPAGERLRRMQQAMNAVLEVEHAEAIHCLNCQQVITPGLFLGETEARGLPALQAGGVNVRLYRVDAPGVAEGRLLMDTIGLHVFGLPDLQIDFRWLDPGAVARTLFAASAYLFDHGDVIEDGHSIEGALPDTRWTANHGPSMLEPHREVLIFDPGSPYSTRDE